MDANDFYTCFENRFRGPRQTIMARLAVYLPFIDPLPRLYDGCRALDLGCGRGEWLELIGSRGFDVRGVDLDQAMLQDCRMRGLSVECMDAARAVTELPDESQVVVSGFHIAEHIQFGVLQRIVQEALRVLRPGGLLILETPNPENLLVASLNFYIDPTHLRPLPPQLLAYLPEYYGFHRTKILRLQESSEIKEPDTKIDLLRVLAGVSPDYAVVAQKKCEDKKLAEFDGPFKMEYGVTFEELAFRYEARLESLRAGSGTPRESGAANTEGQGVKNGARELGPGPMTSRQRTCGSTAGRIGHSPQETAEPGTKDERGREANPHPHEWPRDSVIRGYRGISGFNAVWQHCLKLYVDRERRAKRVLRWLVLKSMSVALKREIMRAAAPPVLALFPRVKQRLKALCVATGLLPLSGCGVTPADCGDRNVYGDPRRRILSPKGRRIYDDLKGAIKTLNDRQA